MLFVGRAWSAPNIHSHVGFQHAAAMLLEPDRDSTGVVALLGRGPAGAEMHTYPNWMRGACLWRRIAAAADGLRGPKTWSIDLLEDGFKDEMCFLWK